MLRTSVCFLALFGLLVATSADAQEPAVSQFHSIDDTGAATFDAQSNARAVVDEILRAFGITAVDWEIKVTTGPGSTQLAVAKIANGKRSIIFNSDFLKRISETSGALPAYCVAAHEIGHLLRLHYQNRFLSRREMELEADYDCGFTLGKREVDYKAVSAVFEHIPTAKEYPVRAERVEAISRGWRDATGLKVEGADEVDDPAKRNQRHTLVLSKFKLHQNRDIFGGDIATTGGKPGIPGVSYVACADKCRTDERCVAFSFDKWNGWCFLKGEAGKTVLDPKTVTGVKKAQGDPQGSGKDFQFSLARNRSFPDAPWDEVATADHRTCRCICGNSQRCVAYTFLEPTAAEPNNCKFFSQTEGYFETPGAVSGYKEQFTAVPGEPDKRDPSVIKQSQGQQADCRKPGSPPS